MKVSDGFPAFYVEVADLARVPDHRREEFYRKLDGLRNDRRWGRRQELQDRWDAMPANDQRAIEGVRRKVAAAFNAARALTAAEMELVDAAYPTRAPPISGPEWVRELWYLATVLSDAAQMPWPSVYPARGRGRRPGTTRNRWVAHTLLESVESCGGRLPSVDHDPQRNTVNKIVKILQPHFPRGAMRSVSAATVRRVQKERKDLPF